MNKNQMNEIKKEMEKLAMERVVKDKMVFKKKLLDNLILASK